MRTINPLKIGKCTFWISFIIGNLFLFGCLFGLLLDFLFRNKDFAVWSAILGYCYLYVATAINLIILFVLLIWGILEKDKQKRCFTSVGIMLINIPLAILYAFVGLGLIGEFSFKRLFEILLLNY